MTLGYQNCWQIVSWWIEPPRVWKWCKAVVLEGYWVTVINKHDTLHLSKPPFLKASKKQIDASLQSTHLGTPGNLLLRAHPTSSSEPPDQQQNCLNLGWKSLGNDEDPLKINENIRKLVKEPQEMCWHCSNTSGLLWQPQGKNKTTLPVCKVMITASSLAIFKVLKEISPQLAIS